MPLRVSLAANSEIEKGPEVALNAALYVAEHISTAHT
jgi:hypothetical protein